MRGAQRRSTRKRRSVGAVLAAGVLVCVSAAVLGPADPKVADVRISEIPAEDFRLVPVPLPEGARYSFGSQASVGVPGITQIWRTETQMVTLRFRPFPIAWANGRSTDLEAALAQARAAGRSIGGGFGWESSLSSSSLFIWVTASPPLTSAEMEKIARSVNVGDDGRSAHMPSPLNLPQVFDGASSLLEPERWWSVIVRSGDQLAAMPPIQSVYAQRSSATAAAIGTDGTDASRLGMVGGRARKVRGSVGRVVERDRLNSTGKPVGKSALLEWKERGWTVSVTAESEEAAVAIAESLREPTDEEWYELVLRYDTNVPIAERRKALNASAQFQVGTGSSKVVVRVGELTTAEGCVNVALQYRAGSAPVGLPDDRLCLNPSGPDLAWSAVRTVSGQTVVVAVVRINADGAILTTDPGSAGSGVGSPAQLGVTPVQPEGVTFESEDPASSDWLGVVVLPFEGDSPGRIELFTDSNFDRSAPSVEVGATDPSVGNGPDAEYQPLLRSLGRFTVEG